MMSFDSFEKARREESRLAALSRLEVLDSGPDAEFDALTHLARKLVGCEMAAISLIDKHRQWFKSRSGIDAAETPREYAFCDHVVASDAMMCVNDATMDDRFSDNPLVTGAPNVRFYAGVPIGVRDEGHRIPIGSMCVIAAEPRELTAEQAESLRHLARLAEALFDARMQAVRSRKLAEERRLMLERQSLSDRQFRQAERLANLGSWRLDLASRAIDWSDQIYVIHGLTGIENMTLDEGLTYYPPRARAEVEQAITTAIESTGFFNFETDFTAMGGEYRRVHCAGEVEYRHGTAVAIVGVMQDVTMRYRLEQTLRLSASTDELTGLGNRAHFNALFEERFAAAQQSGAPLAVLLLDLDKFKLVNDLCGHPAGDAVLLHIAERLAQPWLADCMPARLGGDEFVLIVDSPELVMDLIGTIRTLLADLTHEVAGPDGPIRVSATIGCALLEDEVADRAVLLKHADEALYRAKKLRRGAASVWGEEELILPFALPFTA